MDKDKKVGIAIVISLVAILLIACCFIGKKGSSNINSSFANQSNDADEILNNAQDESSVITDDDKKDFESIDINQYLEFYKGNENKVIFIGRPTCSYCQIADPIVRKINKDYDLNIYYLNTDEFSGDDEATFVKSDEFLENGYGTPMLFIVSNNEIVDKVDGLTDTAHYIEFLTTNKII